jgi:hypothetical protein
LPAGLPPVAFLGFTSFCFFGPATSRAPRKAASNLCCASESVNALLSRREPLRSGSSVLEPTILNEPSDLTRKEIGSLCMAWAFLEFHSEATLWGITGITQPIGEIFTWRMPLRDKWNMITKVAKKNLSEDEYKELKEINRYLVQASRDRNIIVHGIVHAVVSSPVENLSYGDAVGPTEEIDPSSFVRIPCWTIFIGEDAGKNFAVSNSAVEMVRVNIQKIAQMVIDFNKKKGFTTTSQILGGVEQTWPTPL